MIEYEQVTEETNPENVNALISEGWVLWSPPMPDHDNGVYVYSLGLPKTPAPPNPTPAPVPSGPVAVVDRPAVTPSPATFSPRG